MRSKPVAARRSGPVRRPVHSRSIARQARRKPGKRTYDVLKTNRLNADFLAPVESADMTIKGKLKKARGLSRSMCANDPYAKKFLRLLMTNVIGPHGVGFQNKAKEADGQLDRLANEQIEAAYKDWCRKCNASANGLVSWLQLQNLAITSVARDGEIFIRVIENFPNKYGFALQPLEADMVDDELNGSARNGNEIRMGVEIDAWGRPVAYYVLTNHPGDYHYSTGQRHERIPAEEIIHLFLMERVGQTRGIPWLLTSAQRMRMLAGYEEAELVAARTSASKMGFFIETGGDEYDGDDEDGDGNLVSEVSPGQFERLPAGVTFEGFDPQHPTTAFKEFHKGTMRGAAAGLGPSYNSLASDAESVNFSSLRHFTLEDRDFYKTLQQWLVEDLHSEVYSRWLRMAFLKGVVRLPFTKFDKFNAPFFQPRGWDWVDPAKDTKAKKESLGLTHSYQQVCTEQGRDFYEMVDEMAEAQEYAKSKGVTLATANPQKEEESSVEEKESDKDD
ncbi:phage portal protein [Pseudodesulfovibrio sp. JC047]|uniref:phage portal protein n=1 Tax=Pseudodesulfovibrio sp. JC047 TaxID=2683199 RepID=UPI0013D6BEB6|nr:phage portal protein [Pseudodesulfovibrio sp. JC047]